MTEVSQLDGIGRRMPWTMGAFAVGAISMIGLPPTAGFLGKWFILSGAVESANWFAVGVIAVSTVLNAGYFLPIVFRAFFRAPTAIRTEHGHYEGGEAPFADRARADRDSDRNRGAFLRARHSAGAVETDDRRLTVEEDHWLVRDRTIRLLWIVFAVVLAATVLADLFVAHQPFFGFDGSFGFGAWFGFASCVALILFARALGVLLKRPDSYYDD